MPMCFFFNDTATTEIYTLSLHDALPILFARGWAVWLPVCPITATLTHRLSNALAQSTNTTLRRATRNAFGLNKPEALDRKSTRLNSSHANISYAVFCLKKKTTTSS